MNYPQLQALLDSLPSVSCENFHHDKSDRHEYDTPCKPLQRYLLAVSMAQDLLKNVPGEGMNHQEMRRQINADIAKRKRPGAKGLVRNPKGRASHIGR